MFEKISIAITTLLVVMFITLYYYQNGTEPPQECVALHNDYITLSTLIESDEYRIPARKVFSDDKIQYIHNIEKNYQRLLKERFKRSGVDDFRAVCLKAKNTMNIATIIKALEEQRQINIGAISEKPYQHYDFLF